MKRIFLFVAVIMGLHVPAHAFQEMSSIQIPGMRFYAVKAINIQSQGEFDLLAVGQINQSDRNDALIIAFTMADGRYKEIAREVFRIRDKAKTGNTRICSMVCIKDPSTNQYLVVVNGKGGAENREIGFIRSYVFKDAFNLVDTIEFSDPETAYTHGYPLIQADVDGDGKTEMVYGGFSGENDRDRANIRVFSIGTKGELSPSKGFETKRLDALRLRINALGAGDFNKDGKLEVAAAGRTVENDMERAAFAVFSGKSLIWKKLDTLGSCRYRYATVTDMTGDGRQELVLGGRIDQGDTSLALLDIWRVKEGDMQLISRYRFTGAGSTRLRVVEGLPTLPGRLIIGGRMETLQNDRLKWKGFLQQMTFKSGTLFPSSEPLIMDKAWETRIRAMDIYKNSLITAGFTEDKSKASTAFITIYQLD
ncbi:MAG: VCBS repeat-containing protein [Pseudomonadota bacterium]